MISEEVHIEKNKLYDMYQDWYNHNKEEIHPTTKFHESLGLIYKRSYKNGVASVFVIEDSKRFFIAKIKYGI